jgi:hypothetical protein
MDARKVEAKKLLASVAVMAAQCVFKSFLMHLMGELLAIESAVLCKSTRARGDQEQYYAISKLLLRPSFLLKCRGPCIEVFKRTICSTLM